MTRDRNLLANSAQATQAAKLPGLTKPKAGDQAGLMRWIDAVTEHLQVRQGGRRSTLEATVTKRELQEATGATQIVAGGPANGVLMQLPNGSWAKLSIDAFASLIKSTALYKDLLKRIDDPTRFDRLSAELKNLLIPDLNELAKQRGADIQQFDTKIQDSTQSLASRVTEVTAAMDQATAGLRQTMFAQATHTYATAAYALQITARLDDLGGAGLEEVYSVTADRLTGLESQWVLKTNAGGAYASIGVAATSSVAGVGDSSIILVANRLAFVRPSDVVGTGSGEIDPSSPDTSLIPFGVDASGVYINGTVRINAGGSTPTLASLAAATGIYISFTSEFWKVDSAGSPVNTSIVLTANFTAGLSGTVTWTKSGAGTTPPTAGTSNTYTVNAADQTDDTCTYTASYTTGGTTYTDNVTIVRLRDGSNALTAMLSNESHTVPADSTGAVTDYTGASGTMRVFKGSTELTTPAVSFSIPTGGNPDGLTASINSTTGVYSATGTGSWSTGSRTTTITFRATVGSVTLDKTFTLTKANNGAAGSNGSNGSNGTRTAVLDMYQWSATTPVTFPSGDSTYTWSTGQFTAPPTPNGWSATPGAPVLGQTLYIARQVFVDTGTASTSTVTWSTSTALTITAAGTNGTRIGVLEVYKWAAAQPTTSFPSGTSTYTWATGAFTAPGTLNGWSLVPPAPVSGQTLWAAQQVVTDTGTTTTTNVTWAAAASIPVSYAGSNGTNGSNGAAGARGSLTGYGAMYGLTTSSWPDADPFAGGTADKQANAVIYNMLNGTALTTKATTAHLQIGDTVTLSNGSSFSGTKYWSGSGWLRPGVVIDGNLLVLGTVSALMFDGVGLRVGTGRTLNGKAFEVTSVGVVWADNLVVGRGVTVQNQSGDSAGPMTVTGYTNHQVLLASTASTNTGSVAHAIRGVNNHSGSSGLVGLASAYDFYAEGSGTNYGPFTGAHDGLLGREGEDLALVQGDIVVDVRCAAAKNVSGTLWVVRASSKPNQKSAIGVLASERTALSADHPPAALQLGWEQDVEEVMQPDGSVQEVARYRYVVDPQLEVLARAYDRIAFNAVGEGQINVCGEGGLQLRGGDLIVTSSMPGKGMKQADDIVRSYTVAKVRGPDEGPDDSVVATFDGPADCKLVPCIFLCG